MTAPTIRSYLQIFSRFGGTRCQKVHFSTFSGKLTFQSNRNGLQNPTFCPGSLQDTFYYLFLDISPTYFPNIVLQSVLSPINTPRKLKHFCLDRSRFFFGARLFQTLRFPDFQIFDFEKVSLGNLVFEISTENNKGVMGRPWTKRRVLRTISNTLKFPNVETVEFGRFGIINPVQNRLVSIRTVFRSLQTIKKLSESGLGPKN